MDSKAAIHLLKNMLDAIETMLYYCADDDSDIIDRIYEED